MKSVKHSPTVLTNADNQFKIKAVTICVIYVKYKAKRHKVKLKYWRNLELYLLSTDEHPSGHL